MDQEVPDWDSLKEKDLAQMCGVSGDQPCAVSGSTDQHRHEFQCILVGSTACTGSCTGSGWHSTVPDLNQWLRIDLGRRSMINRVVVHPPIHGSGRYANRVDGIQIHVGNDDERNVNYFESMDNRDCGKIEVPQFGAQFNAGPLK